MNEQRLAVVTGGAGFIGSHLCKRLTDDGYTVISLDNYFTGFRDNHVPGVDYREGHTKDIEKHIPETPAIVYHLGEYSRVAQSMDEPDLVWDLNIVGTAGVLEFCRKRKCKIVYAGSSTILANARADGTKGRDLAPYTWGKSTTTDLVKRYGQWYDVSYAIAYFYNVYGPGERAGKYGSVVEIFRQACFKGEPLKVNAPGTQTRIYTHVEDTVDGLLLIGEKGNQDEYGIGSNDSISTLDLAKLFTDNIVMMPERKTSRPSGNLDTTKIRELGWSQKQSLKAYIESIKHVSA